VEREVRLTMWSAYRCLSVFSACGRVGSRSWRAWRVAGRGLYYATAAATAGPRLEFLDLGTGAVHEIDGAIKAPDVTIPSLAVSPDGKQVAAGGWPDSAWVWDLASRLVARKLDTHRGLVHSIAFRPGDKGLIAGDESGTLHLWPERGHPWEFKGEAGAVRAIALTPDGRNSSTGERATWPASGTSWRTGAC